MLKDRRVLLEHEVVKAKAQAANMYLSIVVSGNDYSDPEYQTLKNNILELEFQLNMINILISQGHE